MSFIIKMDPIKSADHLSRAISYIINLEKTGGLFYGNSGSTAQQMFNTFQLTKRLHPARGNREGYHFKISFSKDEKITPEEALEFVREWSEGYLKGKYDYCCAVHQDRDHLHMHLVFNSVSREGGKYRYEKGDWERIIKPLSNRLAEKYHTGKLKEKDLRLDYSSSIDKRTGTGASRKIHENDRVSGQDRHGADASEMSWKEIVQTDIDQCIARSCSYEDFKHRLVSEFHYQLREGVSKKNGIYLALTPPGRAKAIRSYRLDKGYSPSEIEARIEKRFHVKDELEAKYPSPAENGMKPKSYNPAEDDMEPKSPAPAENGMEPKSYNPEESSMEQEFRSLTDTDLDWVIIKNYAFIPFGELSDYQRSMVQKVMDAKRLYHRTGTPLHLHEQSVHAIILLVRETSKFGMYRKIRTGWVFAGKRLLKKVNQVSQSMKSVNGGEKRGRGI